MAEQSKTLAGDTAKKAETVQKTQKIDEKISNGMECAAI